MYFYLKNTGRMSKRENGRRLGPKDTLPRDVPYAASVLHPHPTQRYLPCAPALPTHRKVWKSASGERAAEMGNRPPQTTTKG